MREWRRHGAGGAAGGGGGYLKNLPELISYAAEPGQKVTNEKGLGHAVAPQHDQVLGQVLWRRQLRSKIKSQTPRSQDLGKVSFTH